MLSMKVFLKLKMEVDGESLRPSFQFFLKRKTLLIIDKQVGSFPMSCTLSMNSVVNRNLLGLFFNLFVHQKLRYILHYLFWKPHFLHIFLLLTMVFSK